MKSVLETMLHLRDVRTKDARDYVSKIDSKIILIDGDQLTGLMIDYGIGVAQVASYTVKRLDSDYFVAE